MKEFFESLTKFIKDNGYALYLLFLALCFLVPLIVTTMSFNGKDKEREFESRLSEAKTHCTVVEEIKPYQEPSKFKDCMNTYLKVTEPTQYNRKFPLNLL